MHTFHGYVDALEEEKKKILVFHRELPLSLELVSQAIESCRKELSTPEQINPQSDCSERTTSDCGGAVVCEEFIPIKWSSSSSEERESCEPNKEDGADEKTETENNVDQKNSDWLSLRSVQLWNHSPDPQPKVDEVIHKKAKVVEVKSNAGAFQPFQKETPLAAKVDSQPLKAISPTPMTTSTSTAESGGVIRDSEQQRQSLMHRKQRRCWSPELHRRFVNALQQLGGSNVATPKQIRDLMKVDGLTNDEVKSHLQKYRLHTKRPAAPAVSKGGEDVQQPQFMVVEDVWVPSHDTTNNRVYAAPVAVQPQQSAACGERSNKRCKSPTTSSSFHTRYLLPLS